MNLMKFNFEFEDKNRLKCIFLEKKRSKSKRLTVTWKITRKNLTQKIVELF